MGNFGRVPCRSLFPKPSHHIFCHYALKRTHVCCIRTWWRKFRVLLQWHPHFPFDYSNRTIRKSSKAILLGVLASQHVPIYSKTFMSGSKAPVSFCCCCCCCCCSICWICSGLSKNSELFEDAALKIIEFSLIYWM